MIIYNKVTKDKTLLSTVNIQRYLSMLSDNTLTAGQLVNRKSYHCGKNNTTKVLELQIAYDLYKQGCVLWED